MMIAAQEGEGTEYCYSVYLSQEGIGHYLEIDPKN